jgi:hypothetical protein
MERSMTDLTDLATLDPVRHWRPDAVEKARAQALIDDLMSGDLSAVAAPAPRLARRRLLAGAAAVAVLAAGTVAASVLLPGGTPQAYASWTPIPQTVTGAQVLPQAQACANGWGTSWGRAPVASDILLAERRGTATLLITRKGDTPNLVACTVLDPAAGTTGAELLDPTADTPAPDSVSVQSMGASSGDDHVWHSDVIGRADPSVTGVDVVLPDGRTIQASTSAGWWAAWWPGHEAGEADAVRIIVHTATGSRTYRTGDL